MRKRSKGLFQISDLPIRAAVALTVVSYTCEPAHAAGSGMPWEAPLTQILTSIEGPVAKVVAVIVIIVTGLTPADAQIAYQLARFVEQVRSLSSDAVIVRQNWLKAMISSAARRR